MRLNVFFPDVAFQSVCDSLRDEDKLGLPEVLMYMIFYEIEKS
jgi:hypothetical protein